LFKLYKGIKVNWSVGIRTPSTEEIKGILKVFWVRGTLLGNINPFCIPTCGTVGDKKG